MDSLEAQYAFQASELQAIQTLIAQDAPLERTLSNICDMIEARLPDAMSSIMIFDWESDTLSFRAGGRLPIKFREAAQRVPIGPNCAICGAAAYRREPVLSADILNDPNCAGYWDLARELDLRAGWSHPLQTHDGRLLGTFAVYYRKTGVPDETQRRPIEQAAALVSLAIERDQDRRTLHENEQRYRSLFTYHPDAVFSLDEQGVLRSVNEAACTITGVAEEQLIGLHYREFVIPEDIPETDRWFNAAKHGKPQRYETRIRDVTGGLRVLDVTNLPSVVDGRIAGVYGIAKDVTERKHQETQLRILERSAEASANGIVIADAVAPDLPLIYVNESFLEMTGYERREVIGHNCRFMNGPETDPEALRLLRNAIAEQREVRATLINYRKDGTPFWNDLFISPVPDETGRVTHFVGIQQDVSVQKAHEENLAHQATHDQLTGLPNRSLLEDRLESTYENAERDGSLLAVLYIDLDDFKPVNDTLGHFVGDQLLTTVARRLSGIIAPGDMLAGVGGDEFVILLPQLEESAEALVVAERALRVLDRPHRIDGHDIHVTCSIGIAANDNPIEHSNQLIQHADMAMYLAKREGRNTYHWYTADITQTMNERVALRRELHQAIVGQQFELYYQPLVAATGAVVSFEALIRWHHPERGLVSPATFIPLAEQTGQITAIGEWVMQRACRDLVALNATHGHDYAVAVNISPVQFHGRNFLGSVIDVLNETGIAPRLLKIELTEGVLMENTDAAIDILHTLRRMGVEVFLDDFGTGFSSLSYLKHLPISKVKIDRSFIREIATSSHDAAIAQGVITMSHHLGLQVVAEGIETTEQHRFLAARRCDLFQGYLFARPMPIDNVFAYLESRACV